MIGVTDPKGGYDHITAPVPGCSQDLRSAIDVAIVRSSMKRPQTSLRWVEGTQQLTDPLTKKAREGDLLRAALRFGDMRLSRGARPSRIGWRRDSVDSNCEDRRSPSKQS